MKLTQTILFVASLLSVGTIAIDHCDGDCTPMSSCKSLYEGESCCSNRNSKTVLNCKNGKWVYRNSCTGNGHCCCTGDYDIVCSNVHSCFGRAKPEELWYPESAAKRVERITE